MKIKTHPKELTRENLEKWRKEFVKKIERTTTRTDLDRLILAVERREFEKNSMGGWTEVIFQNKKGNVTNNNGNSEEFVVSKFEQTILEREPNLNSRNIEKSDLKEEDGEWQLDKSLKKISFGGEAVVLEEIISGLKVAVRVACFDPALFTGDMEEYEFEWHLSKDFEIAKNKRKDNTAVIPHHKNVVEHFANCEIKQEEEVVGWITVMEFCETDLSKLLTKQNGGPTFEERKKNALGVIFGFDYLKKIGIEHMDKKPENVLMKNGIPKLTDFGLTEVTNRRESYRQMGYARRGNKFRDWSYLHAGSAGFARGQQLGQLEGNQTYQNSALFILILCDWKTAWSLLFKPLDNGEREIIKKELESFNAGWLEDAESYSSIKNIKKLTDTITLKNASSNFNLDDENLTKSCAMTQLKQRMTRVVNFDFQNLTKNVLDQKDSNLCVPISVSVLLRWAINNDLKVDDWHMKKLFTVEKILILLTMIIYPRSLAGLNLNPKNDEKEFQLNEIELLLKRIKNKTYLYKSGWDIIRTSLLVVEGSFEFNRVLLHSTFTPTRPLTVTGAYKKTDGDLIFHQMILDRVEFDEYVLQNTLFSSELASTQNLPLLRIDRQRRYYGIFDMFNNPSGVINRPNGEFLLLTNEYCNLMNEEEWYLLPEAYSITLTPDSDPGSNSYSRTTSFSDVFEPQLKKKKET